MSIFFSGSNYQGLASIPINCTTSGRHSNERQEFSTDVFSLYSIEEIRKKNPEYLNIVENLIKLQTICERYDDSKKQNTTAHQSRSIAYEEVFDEMYNQNRINIWGGKNHIYIKVINKITSIFTYEQIELYIDCSHTITIKKNTNVISSFNSFDLLDLFFNALIQWKAVPELSNLNIILEQLIIEYI